MKNDCIFDLQGPEVPAEPHAGGVRTLLPLPRVTGCVPKAFPKDGRVIAIVDCEATSLNPFTAKIIELAVMGIIVDGEGRVVGNTPISSWLEDPGEALSDEVKLVTGIDDEMLAGQSIDERAALGILNRAEMIVAHNASYDAPIMERRLPTLTGKAFVQCIHQIFYRLFIKIFFYFYDYCSVGTQLSSHKFPFIREILPKTVNLIGSSRSCLLNHVIEIPCSCRTSNNVIIISSSDPQHHPRSPAS